MRIPGVPVSGNAKTRFSAVPIGMVNGQMKYSARGHSTKEAKEYAARIESLARYEAIRIRWVMPKYVRLDMIIYNIAQDRDNVHKVVADALQKIAFPTDGRILDGWIKKRKDREGPRVELVVQAVNGKDYGYS